MHWVYSVLCHQQGWSPCRQILCKILWVEVAGQPAQHFSDPALSYGCGPHWHHVSSWERLFFILILWFYVCHFVIVVAFSIWMDTHKSRSVHMSQGFYMLQSSHWHGPCTSDDTLPFGWLKKEAAAAASGFFPRLGFADRIGLMGGWSGGFSWHRVSSWAHACLLYEIVGCIPINRLTLFNTPRNFVISLVSTTFHQGLFFAKPYFDA